MPVETMSPTRFRLRELLEEAGVGQSEFAKAAHVSFATVNRLCTNATAQVSLETLDKIANELSKQLGREVHPGELLDYKPERRRGR